MHDDKASKSDQATAAPADAPSISVTDSYARDLDEDPFAYVPQSTLPVHAPHREEDAWAASPAPHPRLRPASAATPAPSANGRMILSLSPAARTTPPSSMSRWHGFLG